MLSPAPGRWTGIQRYLLIGYDAQVAGPAGVVHDPVLAVADPRLRPLPLLHHRGHAAAEARRHQLRQGGTRPPQVGVQGQTQEMYCVNIYSGSSRSNELYLQLHNF